LLIRPVGSETILEQAGEVMANVEEWAKLIER
jgi:hypothetical protein